MQDQTLLSPANGNHALYAYLRDLGCKRLLIVHDGAYPHLRLHSNLDNLSNTLGIQVTHFSDFQPNPRYESVETGVQRFRDSDCDAVLAIGGGSALDVAKCVKLYADMTPGDVPFLHREVQPNSIPLIAIPTTAGTGSEATRFAVIYYEGVKQSIAHDSILPQAVVLDPQVLESLPEYQRKATLLDALCHAVESFWNVNSTVESRTLAAQAIQQILANMDAYLSGDTCTYRAMLEAAHRAGKAINITQTTAGHAMCYKMTSLYGAAHGHAAALVNRRLWRWTLRHLDQCIDPRGEAYLRSCFDELADAMGCTTAEDAAEKFERIFSGLKLPVPEARAEDFPVLCASVNPERLRNHPVRLTATDIDALYHEILTEKVD